MSRYAGAPTDLRGKRRAHRPGRATALERRPEQPRFRCLRLVGQGRPGRVGDRDGALLQWLLFESEQRAGKLVERAVEANSIDRAELALEGSQ